MPRINTTEKPSCGTCQRFLRSPCAKQWGMCLEPGKPAPHLVTLSRFNQHYSNGGPRCPAYVVRSDEELAAIRQIDL